MRFIPAEPDIATVFGRIVEGDIDLQPDFQRGEVWPTSKKQRLIDSILRGWVVPPVLLISGGHGERQQVLDGQQRLASIRDFVQNEFAVDGRIQPADPKIMELHGMKFSALPPDIRRAFLRTPVRMYEITDYNPEEPAEIFFRLNQPTGLTSAEKRNAFFGPVRDQIRIIVDTFEKAASDGSYFLGFSNGRMAYDDVFARFACSLEMGTLRTKVTAAAVNEMYRRKTPIPEDVLKKIDKAVQLAIEIFDLAASLKPTAAPRLNKATFFSWLLFFARLDSKSGLKGIAEFFLYFENVRIALSESEGYGNDSGRQHSAGTMPNLMLVYNDRASARVSDVSSVLLRDFALWASWWDFSLGSGTGFTEKAYVVMPGFIENAASIGPEKFEAFMLQTIEDIRWGGEL